MKIIYPLACCLMMFFFSRRPYLLKTFRQLLVKSLLFATNHFKGNRPRGTGTFWKRTIDPDLQELGQVLGVQSYTIKGQRGENKGMHVHLLIFDN